jgi:hypothetical protein
MKGKECYTENEVIIILRFLIDSIFVEFGGHSFQQIIGIPIGINCAPLLVDLSWYSSEAELKKTPIKDKQLQT